MTYWSEFNSLSGVSNNVHCSLPSFSRAAEISAFTDLLAEEITCFHAKLFYQNPFHKTENIFACQKQTKVLALNESLN